MGFYDEDDFWRCRKHPSSNHPTTGVCPLCLRDRLLRLCPECAHLRPCACRSSSSSSSSSASSFSLSSSASDFILSATSGGAIGRMSTLIDSEPAFRRSRSGAVFSFRRSNSRLPPSGKKPSSSSLWSSIFKMKKAEEREEEKQEKSNLVRSKSVGMSEGKAKGRNWYFPSPIKVFRQSKNASSRILQQQSPLCRG